MRAFARIDTVITRPVTPSQIISAILVKVENDNPENFMLITKPTVPLVASTSWILQKNPNIDISNNIRYILIKPI
jgi:hypothetical protein